jgi:hypothetical protein
MIESGQACVECWSVYWLYTLLRRCMLGSGVARSFRPKPHSPDESQRVSLMKAISISATRVEVTSKFEELTRTTEGKEEETHPLTRPRNGASALEICSFRAPIIC